MRYGEVGPQRAGVASGGVAARALQHLEATAQLAQTSLHARSLTLNTLRLRRDAHALLLADLDLCKYDNLYK